MSIKYTSDGRKVLVVGKLNAEQHIVQEIFVSGDQEIPSGENFVASSLHDAPVESWKDKKQIVRFIREVESELDAGYARHDCELHLETDAIGDQVCEICGKNLT